MWKAFEKLAQANVDHYNTHPTRHTVITAVYAVAAVAGGLKFAHAVGKSGSDIRSGQYANMK